MQKEVPLLLIPYEKETGIKLKEVLSSSSSVEKVSVFIGPEGGFTETEIETAVSCGICPVTLGPRIFEDRDRRDCCFVDINV